MEKIYLDKEDRISKMLENKGKMTKTDEDKTEFSYNGKTFIVSTPYLNDIMSQNVYDDRTIGSLTGIGIAPLTEAPSSYASQLSQMKEYSAILKPRKPGRLFSELD